MTHADLRLHLAAQGLARTALVPWTAYAQGVDNALAQALATSPDAVLFDVLQPSDLPVVGRVLRARTETATLLAAGPSSVLGNVGTATDLAFTLVRVLDDDGKAVAA